MGWIRFRHHMSALCADKAPPPNLPRRGGGRASSLAHALRTSAEPAPSPPRRGLGRGAVWQWAAGLSMLAAAIFTAPAFAQSVPYHADPDAREILPSLTPVPAIRFLTTGDFPPFNFRDQTGNLVGYNI